MKKTMEKKRAIATVFFGSTTPSAIRAYDEIEERIRRKPPGIPVFRACTSERIRRKPDGTVPSLPELLQRLAVEKYTDIDLPADDHAQNDMAGKDPDSRQSRLTNAGFECISILRGLGENPQTAEFFAPQVSKNNGKKS